MDALFRRQARRYWLIENRRFRSRSFEGLADAIFHPSLERVFRLFEGVSFSTATLLKSAPTAVHKDSANADAGLTCLTTLGKFTGGSLLFPQFGLELPVQPGDLIIAATHRHWHCNVRKRVGTRYSVITYYRERLVDKLAKALRSSPHGRTRH